MNENRTDKKERLKLLTGVAILTAMLLVTAGGIFSGAGIFAPMIQYAEAGILLHGAGAQKACEKVAFGDTNDCLIRGLNIDDFGDTLVFDDLCDLIGITLHCMSTDAGLSIVSVTGGASCAAGNTTVPCTVPPGGAVLYRDQSFIMNSTVADQGQVFWRDTCNVSSPCSTGPQIATAGGLTIVINPAIQVVKTIDPSKVASGGQINVTANVTNIGNAALSGITAVDTEAGPLVCGDTTLDPGNSTLCTGSFNPVGSGTNTVNATGFDQLDNTVFDTDSRDFEVIRPAIQVVKTIDPSKVASGGQINVTANVTNIGDTTLSGITAVDTEAGPLVCGVTTLDPGNSTLCTGSFNPVGSGTNTVNATGFDQLRREVFDTDSRDFRVINPAIEVTKECEPPTQTEPGTINWTVVITNTGDIPLNVTAIDTQHGIIFNGTIAAGANVTIVNSDPGLAAGNYTNLVNVTGVHQLGAVEASAQATCEVTAPAGEGCTPGFWKANAEKKGAVAWPPGILPTQSVQSIFSGINDADTFDSADFADDSLLKALGYGGGTGTTGAAKILLRAGVAAYLNAADAEVNYPLTPSEVQDLVNDALNTNSRSAMLAVASDLDDKNNLGCSQDQQGRRIEEV